MNYLKDNPVGIDVKINRIQEKMYQPITDLWGSIDFFGRVYKKTRKNGSPSLERYVGSGEYQPVLNSEGNKIFFVQGSKPDINLGQIRNDLWIVCIVKIENIRNIEHRADEEVHSDFLTELSKNISSKDIIGLEYGMSNLQRVVEDSFSFGNFKFSDIHPYHVFMVKTNISYKLINNKC